jgi:hypothetical protein
MLVDPKVVGERNGLMKWLFGERGGDFRVERIQTGVILMHEFNGEKVLRGVKSYFPNLIIKSENGWKRNVECFGVCDNLTQVLEMYNHELNKPRRKFAISLTPVNKRTREWRWIDGGTYIGDLNPQEECFCDEGNEFKVVYCYHIYELE